MAFCKKRTAVVRHMWHLIMTYSVENVANADMTQSNIPVYLIYCQD